MINLEAKQKTSYCECMNVMSLRGRRQFKSVILLVCKSGVELFFSIFGGMGDLTIGQSFFYSVGAMSSFLVKDQFFGSAPLLLCGGFDFKEKNVTSAYMLLRMTLQLRFSLTQLFGPTSKHFASLSLIGF